MKAAPAKARPRLRGGYPQTYPRNFWTAGRPASVDRLNRNLQVGPSAKKNCARRFNARLPPH